MEKTYFYRNGDAQVGPVTVSQMRGSVTPETYVWAEGMPTWQTISQMPELMSQLGLVSVSSYQQPQQQYSSYNSGSSYNSSSSYGSSSSTLSSGSMPPQPDNHLVLSIISIFLCQILGIIALVMSLQSDSCYKKGDYDGSVQKAKTAKTLALIGIISMGAFWVIYILFVAFAAGAGALQSY